MVKELCLRAVPVAPLTPEKVLARFQALGTVRSVKIGFLGGSFDPVALPAQTPRATTTGGYAVRIDAGRPTAGAEAALSFDVTRAGRPATVEPYLGARGHLVALRASDLAFLHVHPTDSPRADGGRVRFATTFATAGRYRLFLQFNHQASVRTAAFTVGVAR